MLGYFRSRLKGDALRLRRLKLPATLVAIFAFSCLQLNARAQEAPLNAPALPSQTSGVAVQQVAVPPAPQAPAASPNPILPQAPTSPADTATQPAAAQATVATPGTEIPPAEPPKPKFDMVDAAARYVALVKEANRMTFPNALASESIASSLVITSRLSSKEITEGLGAYATLTIANDPAFNASVQTAVGFLGRAGALARLKEDPNAFIGMISGSSEANKLASGAISGSLAKLKSAQTVLGEAAYALQRERWAMEIIDTPATLAAHRAAAIAPSGLTPFVSSDLPATPSDEPVNNRYVIAATFRLLGDDASATALLDKPLGRMCMNRVQLNVRQCLAASRHPFEHSFCLSQHSFGETHKCVSEVAK
jgi:hypothetical protein